MCKLQFNFLSIPGWAFTFACEQYYMFMDFILFLFYHGSCNYKK